MIRLPAGTVSKLQQLTPADLQTLPAPQRERLQAAITAQPISCLDGPALGEGDSCVLGDLVACDAPDPRAQLPEDLELLETVQSLGYRGTAAHRGEPIARLKVAAERAFAKRCAGIQHYAC